MATSQTGTAALAQKLVSGKLKSAKIHGVVAVSRAYKKSETKKADKKATKKTSEIEYRTKMADGKTNRKVYKAGSGMIEELTKMLKSGKTVEAIARHFGKENKDITWYVSRLRKNGELPKNFTAKRDGK